MAYPFGERMDEIDAYLLAAQVDELLDRIDRCRLEGHPRWKVWSESTAHCTRCGARRRIEDIVEGL